MKFEYSFIIPVYNRPEEIRELLQSMLQLHFSRSFEIVIVEDGSIVSSEEMIMEFSDKLNISYYYKENTGPGDSRNYGMKLAKGNYFLILDSDVLLPEYYLEEVDTFLSKDYYDCFGGPDAAHESFTDLQKAINYSMTSLLTTGGIRGNKQTVNKFQPRSFNMGLSKAAFLESGGFGLIHPGEDPDLVLRLQKVGFRTILIPDAVVYHKRRVNWNNLYMQVNKFGMVRPILNLWHPASAKITYWFPSLFTLGLLFSLILLLLGYSLFIFLYLIYFVIIGLDAGIKNKSGYIGIAAMMAAFIQFSGYGIGFLNSVWKLNFLKQQPQEAFPKLFFTNEI